MTIQEATSQAQWDAFLANQTYSPFLQSWTMGEVYRDIGEEPIRLEIREANQLVGICQAIVVPARRGKHLAIPYLTINPQPSTFNMLINELKKVAVDNDCSFIRVSPFWPKENSTIIPESKPSPLHLLAEHIWCLDLRNKTEGEIMKNMRQNHRNLIRRADREGVEVIASTDPEKDLEEFFELYDETRKRHKFVPYPNNFIKSQVRRFSAIDGCTLYLAKYQGETLATSVHMHFGGETSYHHGASTNKYPKIPASYALQWRAICDAIKRGDHMFNFWGISPEGVTKHPFAGVRTFKTGFGGELLELVHCLDIPVSKKYYLTRAFESWRKWKRGF